MLAHPERFLTSLRNFRGEIETGRVPSQNVAAVREIVSAAEDGCFTAEHMRSISKRNWAAALASLCGWVNCALAYYHLVVPDGAAQDVKTTPAFEAGEVKPFLNIVSTHPHITHSK